MLDKERVQAEIAQVQEQYANGLCTKIEALDAMITAVQCEVNNHIIERFVDTDFYPEDASDYVKAIMLRRTLKRIEKFKNSISFGDILQHRPI